MAAPDGRADAALSTRLFREPYAFDFFQAVRLLEALARERPGADGPRRPVGHDFAPEQEVVRFRAHPALGFPASPLRQLGRPAGPDAPAEMAVTFLGLVGPSGVLPHHYTRLLLRRLREHDHGLRDFLDLFHHRTVSLFYRAWEKYRVTVALERARLDPAAGEDLFSRCLYSLAGVGTGALREWEGVPDQTLLYYGGHFAHFPRSASALKGILEDYFALPVEVQELQGQWLILEQGDRAVLPAAGRPPGANVQLGVDLVIGERVWDVQSKFRLRLGPLTSAEFHRFLPGGAGLRALAGLTRSFVGLELEADVQLVLPAPEVPWCRLGTPDGPEAPRLGWNTWVRAAAFGEELVTDAVFFLTGASRPA